jgi:hypothetical protein
MAKKQTNSQKTSFEKLLADFEGYMIRDGKRKKGTIDNYKSHLNKINGNTNSIITWLEKVKHDKNPEQNPIKCLCALYDEQYSNRNWKSALILFGKFVFGKINAQVNLASVSIKNFDQIACKLVAQSAIFCSKEVFDKVKDGELGSPRYNEHGNDEGAWYGYQYRRAKANEKRRVNDPNDPTAILDDNTYANKAIKYAICEDLKKYGISVSINDFSKNEFEACHIWDETCYNKKYHTSVANLVLLPRSLASLTDHCDAVKKLLQYEAWRRFGFKPEGDEYYQSYSNVTSNTYPQEEPQYYNDVKWKYPESNYTNPRKRTTNKRKAKKKQ